MRPAIIWRIASKEILSTLRDRRAIVSSLLIPLLVLPLVMLGLPLLLGGLFEREQTTTTEVAVRGLDNLPDQLRRDIEAQSITLTPTDAPEAAVREGDYAVGLGVPPNFEAAVQRGQGELTVYNKAGNLRGELSVSKLEDAIDTYKQALIAQRLRSAGLGPSVLEPLTVKNEDASSQAERSSGQLAWLIPFFIAVWTLAGGQMTAIDATAGEKRERHLRVFARCPGAAHRGCRRQVLSHHGLWAFRRADGDFGLCIGRHGAATIFQISRGRGARDGERHGRRDQRERLWRGDAYIKRPPVGRAYCLFINQHRHVRPLL